MQSLEVSGAVRPLYGSLGVKRLINDDDDDDDDDDNNDWTRDGRWDFFRLLG